MPEHVTVLAASTRREFLGISLAATAAMVVAPPALARATKALPLYAVIHDERFAAGRAFSAEARRRGIATRPVRGMVHDLWRDDLEHQLRARPTALAGMTTPDVVFLLAMMGRDAGMRVIFRAHHVPGHHGGMAKHQMFGPDAVLAGQPRLTGPEALWGRHAARIVTAWPDRAQAFAATHSTIDEAQLHAIDHTALVTWLMVPPVRPA